MEREIESLEDAAKAFFELGWAENESDTKLSFESGANWQKEQDKAVIEQMREALNGMIKMYESVQPAGGWQGVYENAINAINKKS